MEQTRCGKRWGSRRVYAEQKEQLGTAHAVGRAEKILKGVGGLILIFYADMPLLRQETLAGLVDLQAGNSGPLSI